MLDALKRWLVGRPDGPDLSAVRAWAKAAGRSFKRARDGQGFVVEGAGWRLEAGASQRDYIEGPELRLRCERDLPSDLQMLVMSRSLMDGLESETFEQFTDPLQTYADDSTPEEMRWLAMFPKVDAPSLGALGKHFGAVALVPAAARAWLGGALGARLQAAALAVSDEQPIVLMTNRGRVTLRTECHSIDGAAFDRWIALFEAALGQLPDATRALREATA